MVAVFLIVRSKEENGGDNGSDIYEVGVGWLDVFDLEFFSSCFKSVESYSGKMDSNLACWRGSGVRYGLLEWL